jgi:hypothetical protein
MTTYKLINNKDNQLCAINSSNGWSIPIAPDNTDYQQFKKDLANGVQLEDATGTVMTADQIKTFMETLP